MRSSLLPVGSPEEYLPSHFANEFTHRGFCVFPPVAWPASRPNGSGAGFETWRRAAGALQTPRGLEDVAVHIRTKNGVSRGSPGFSMPRALQGLRAAYGGESECMLVFTLLLLLVEGLEVFAVLGFDVVVSSSLSYKEMEV